MFKGIDIDQVGASAGGLTAQHLNRRKSFANPLLKGERFIVRYGAAVVVVLLAGGLRFALSPLLGDQAPLLLFILAVLGTSVLAGAGPALLAALLAPVLATAMFMGGAAAATDPAWWGHALFFVVISVAVTHVMHSLQEATRLERAVQDAMVYLEWEARQSEARSRLMADALPFLISYVDDSQRYRFANVAHRQWFGSEPGALLGCHAQQLWGDEAYRTIRPHLEAALSGSMVDCEIELASPLRSGQFQMHLRPDFRRDGTVKGVFATIDKSSHRAEAPEALGELEARKSG